MSAEGKVGPSIGDVLKAGLEELRSITVAFPTPPPTSPDYDR